MANFVLVSALAVTITFVYGNNDENPLRDIVGYSQWKPLIRWRPQPFPPPASYQRLDESSEYTSNDVATDYAADDDSTGLDSQDIKSKAKRSRVRQPLCEVLVNIVYVGNQTGYQYRPDHYVTESCMEPSYNTFHNKCTETGLSCTQIRQKIFITRRKVSSEDAKTSNCWEHVRMEEIDAGCECMWPREHIGDKHSYRNGK